MKFGGAATRSIANFGQIAAIISKKRAQFAQIAVVVSAMGDTTDQLLTLAHLVHPNPPRRECDMLITTGERVSSSLLAMALDHQGQVASSFTGSQAGIITTEDHADARILQIDPWRLHRAFNAGAIAVIAGFQGVSHKSREITTLGRGGSDTSAVALAVALEAEFVEFYKDVGGIYDEDPKLHPSAKLLRHLTYAQAKAIAAKGAKVLHSRAIDLAETNQIPLHVYGLHEGIDSSVSTRGTLVAPTRLTEARSAFLCARFEESSEILRDCSETPCAAT